MKTVFITVAILSLGWIGSTQTASLDSSFTDNADIETFDAPRCVGSIETVTLRVNENVSTSSSHCAPELLDDCIVCTTSNVIDPPMTCEPCGAKDC